MNMLLIENLIKTGKLTLHGINLKIVASNGLKKKVLRRIQHEYLFIFSSNRQILLVVLKM